MEAQRLPVIIPMWLSGSKSSDSNSNPSIDQWIGFENVKPEPAPAGIRKFLPRLGQSITITFAPPLDGAQLMSILESVAGPTMESMPSMRVNGTESDAGLKETVMVKDSPEERRKREALTAVLQRAVEQLGYVTSGPLLGASLLGRDAPKSFTPR